MLRPVLVAAAALALTLAPAAAQQPAPSIMGKADCDALWTKANGGASGDLAMDKAQPYVKDFKQADKDSSVVVADATKPTQAKNGAFAPTGANRLHNATRASFSSIL